MLCQMTACANHCEVLAGPVEATALGNLAVQFMALGEIKNIKAARRIVSSSENVMSYEPRDAAAWDAAYEEFKGILR